MNTSCILKKVDSILNSNTKDAECLIELIAQYYQQSKKNKNDSTTTKIIQYDFKKREIIAFYEILKESLGKGF